MKKIIISFLVLTLSFGVFAQQDNTMFPPTTADVRDEASFRDSIGLCIIPDWFSGFGKVTFATDRTWIISGNGITQIWSDAVTATNCDKTSFTGRSFANYNVDCRSNPDFSGDLFSWCAVVRFKDTLCPAPWRVPTRHDFANLGRALRDGTRNPSDEEHRDRFLNVWGGNIGGGCFPGGVLYDQGRYALYWAQTEHSATTGHRLFFRGRGNFWGGAHYYKCHGATLRCVKN